MNKAVVVGGGLAGVEAAMQLARAGHAVTLFEMKPQKYSPAHKNDCLAELVCSNSLKAERVESAAGLLKTEMLRFDSLTVQCAQQVKVPAGGALAVDRDAFAALVTKKVEAEPNITLVRQEVCDIPDASVVIIAAGPLVSEPLAEKITALCGGMLSFFDAAAPVVTAESLSMDHAFTQSRYDRGNEDDYINCPLNKEEYERFQEALVSAELAQTHSFDQRKGVYEGCMPIEVMAKRGADTIRFGPMKPVGLIDPKTGRRPWAVLQLRKENRAGTLYNLVGFQTNLKFAEQQRVFSMIPALQNAEYARYGVMHRNTFLNSLKLLEPSFALRSQKNLFFAGQITGVEGYMESAASGILAGMNAARLLAGRPALVLPPETMMGALARYVSTDDKKNFQPMGAAFGLLPPLEDKIRDKNERYARLAARSLQIFESYPNEI
ncbi:MAG: methylenetetrahydrofolate--tRNA-(uracil(54)-C(5))-methyltransferase (FADH(2)-oxidizing) TrmFO [Oscillospiraceae bacterium]|jgi:methylenetetrahydrofolate--tRNA-(uracil-5-)-methyltransferase|nr:methylenetetrahydrofolate--tRNA-(uracil(54)-C(5))-methyltransferase (FADH(2)-oxidizing) TrmFO [Oscillospiraceae bacterium]